MQTRCPYPDCKHVFAPAEQIDGARPTICLNCQRGLSARPLDVWFEIDLRYSQLQERSLPVGLLAKHNFSVVVEDVRSLWNVGSIFRTADGANVSALYLCGISGTPPRKEIAKTSLGAENSVPWSYIKSVTEILPELKAAGIFILGLERHPGDHDIAASIPLSAAINRQQIPAAVCLVVGNEVTGLSLEAMTLCDLICHLPMRGMKESLNVAVAFGIAAYMLAER